jgi:hypothetical protein
MEVAKVQDQVSYKFLIGRLKREHNELLYDAYRAYLVSREFIDENGVATKAGLDFVEWYEDEYVDDYLVGKIVFAFIILLAIVGAFIL